MVLYSMSHFKEAGELLVSWKSSDDNFSEFTQLAAGKK